MINIIDSKLEQIAIELLHKINDACKSDGAIPLIDLINLFPNQLSDNVIKQINERGNIKFDNSSFHNEGKKLNIPFQYDNHNYALIIPKEIKGLCQCHSDIIILSFYDDNTISIGSGVLSTKLLNITISTIKIFIDMDYDAVDIEIKFK